jgi:hypothetical protein
LHRPRDYLKSLEIRVAYLESLLQQSRPEVALDHLEFSDQNDRGNDFSNNDQLFSGAIDRALPASGHGSSQDQVKILPNPENGADNERIDDLSTEVALLCLSASGREPHYFGPSCAVSFSRIVSTTMGLPKRNGSSQHSTTLHDREIERTVSVAFPSLSLGKALSQAYFATIHPQYPFLHQPSFLDWERLCTEACMRGNLEQAGDLPLFFVLMVRPLLSSNTFVPLIII